MDASGTPVLATGKWYVNPDTTIAYGLMSLLCATPNATIKYTISGGPVSINGVLSSNAGQQVYAPGYNQPCFTPTVQNAASGGGINTQIVIQCSATAPGFAPSDTITFTLPLFYQV